MLNTVQYDTITVMDNDFRTTDPILDDQRWWGTLPEVAAEEDRRRQHFHNGGSAKADKRNAKRHFWTIWFVWLAIILAFAGQKIFF